MNRDFEPCVADELRASKGQKVKIVFQENDWVYVIDEEGYEGFIPLSFCDEAAVDKPETPKEPKKPFKRPPQAERSISYPEELRNDQFYSNHFQKNRDNISAHFSGISDVPKDTKSIKPAKSTSRSRSYSYPENACRLLQAEYRIYGLVGANATVQSQNFTQNHANLPNFEQYHDDSTNLEDTQTMDQPTYQAIHASDISNHHNCNSDITDFIKVSYGQYFVLYPFIAQEENDITVMQGEFITVLNMDDPDWYWVQTTDHKEGFVPGPYLHPADGQPFVETIL